MRKKSCHLIILSITLVFAMLLVSCGKTGTPPIRELNGSPYKGHSGCYGLFPEGQTSWVDRFYIDSGYEGSKVPKDSTITLYCVLSGSFVKGHDLANEEKTLLTLYLFPWNKYYSWDKKDSLRTCSGEYLDYGFGHVEVGFVEAESYSFQIDLLDLGYGKYTAVMLRDDNTVDSMIDIEIVKDSELDQYESTAAKPVIYLYPQERTDVSVRLDFDGRLTCTYPEYGAGWDVTAYPDGRIYDRSTSRFYDYLFWEGRWSFAPDASECVACVAASDTSAFLEEYLSAAGLNDSEIDDFISFWLPILQRSPYNLISFPNAEYSSRAALDISPTPDTVIRVYMVFIPLEAPVDIPEEQTLQLPEPVERSGFTIVEWGGTVLDGAVSDRND